MRKLIPTLLFVSILGFNSCTNSIQNSENETQSPIDSIPEVIKTDSMEEADSKNDMKTDSTIIDQTSNTVLPEEEYESTEVDQIGWEIMEKEDFNGIKIGLDSASIVKLIGAPDETSEEQFWGADGGFHSTWTYDKLGLSIGMNRAPAHPKESIQAKQIDRITVQAPSTYSTKRGISIGSSIEDVRIAYKKAISDSQANSNPITLVAGTVYGGLIFTFEERKVSKLFLGAAAE